METFCARLSRASAGRLALHNTASHSRIHHASESEFLGLFGGLRESVQMVGQRSCPVVRATAMAPQVLPSLSLHNVRYVDGESVGDTPKFRQIRMASSLQLPPSIRTPAPVEAADALAGIQAGVAAFEQAHGEQKRAVVKVVGVGYGGSKAIEAMLQKPGVEAAGFVLVAADAESTLDASSGLPETHQIVVGLDKLMGAQLKSDAELEADLEAQLEGADLVVIVAGMGGNTGGIPPVVAKVARRVGALTVGLVTKPFAFEGPRRASLAEKHIAMMKKRTDTLIVVPCDPLLDGKDPHFGVRDAFKLVDGVLRQGVKGLTDMLTGSGLVNAKLSDVQSLLTDAGLASMGVGSATGPNRAAEAAHAAVASPRLQQGLQTAQGVVYSIVGDASLSLYEVAEISEIVHSHVEGFARANVLFAASADENMKGKVLVTVIAAGLRESRLVPVEGRRQAGVVVASRTSKRSSSILWSVR